jgi:hypothetical protein
MSDIGNTGLRSAVGAMTNLPNQAAVEHCCSVQAAGTSDQLSWFGWCRSGRKRMASHFARTAVAWSPPASENAQPSPAVVKRPTPKMAAVHFRNGEALVVAVDEKNEAYLYSCLHGSADTARTAWLETVDACFIGLNLAQLNAVFWYQPGSTAPVAAEWDPARLVVHFADKEAIALHQVTVDTIDRLRAATLSKHRATAFCSLHGQDDAPVSISIENMTYITMPATWLHED